jgi:hypothetical protein
MDGCVSSPCDKISLLNTIRAAIPHHLTLVNASKDFDQSSLDIKDISRINVSISSGYD